VTATGPLSISYGFGLFAEDDAAYGTIVQHSGGYPGYGSQMRWHPATGIGTIVLANSTYAAAGALAGELLAELLKARSAQARSVQAGSAQAGSGTAGPGGYRTHGPVPAPGGPWPETLAARESVNALLQRWDPAAAAALFTPNVDQDRPLAEREADLTRLRERIGQFSPDAARPPECDSPAHCRWWLTGERGTVAVQIKLAPLRQPQVQQLIVPLPPASGSGLAAVLEKLAGALSAGGEVAVSWPADLVTAPGLSSDDALRRLRLAAAWTGPARPDCYLAGNGSTSATVRLTGATGWADLTAEIADADGVLTRLTIALGS